MSSNKVGACAVESCVGALKNTVKIVTSQHDDGVLCTLPNGEQVEVEMFSLEGEYVESVANPQAAVDLLLRTKALS